MRFLIGGIIVLPLGLLSAGVGAQALPAPYPGEAGLSSNSAETGLHVDVEEQSTQGGTEEDSKKASEGTASKFMDAAGLLRFGVTLGVGAAMHFPLGDGTPQQSSVSVSPMPFAVLTPWTWFLGDVTREYCAVRGMLFSSERALDAANAYAETLARKRAPTKWSAPVDDANKRTIILKETDWDITEHGSCWRTAIGVYLGFPLKYDANFDELGDYSTTEAKLTVRPKASFGLGFVPVPYVSLLLGLTSVDIEIPEVAATMMTPVVRGRLESAWALSLTVGGNVDIFKSLLSLD